MIRVAGAGAFGTALAISLAQNGPVSLWTRDAGHAQEMRDTRRNDRRLPGAALPDPVEIETGPFPTDGAEAALLAIPTQRLRDFCAAHAQELRGPALVACCKGMETSTGRRPTEIVTECVPGATAAILTGPSFAADIARGLPTALTLACADDSACKRLQRQLATPTLRIYRTGDVVGAELGGAFKNVIAIACGAAIGAGLGESARAALMTRGFAEMVRAARSQGADSETLSGLAGFGDLALTCASEQSRNFRFGLSLARAEAFGESVVVEGAATASALAEWAEAAGLDLPITGAVAALVDGRMQVGQAIGMLLARPLKEERAGAGA